MYKHIHTHLSKTVIISFGRMTWHSDAAPANFRLVSNTVQGKVVWMFKYVACWKKKVSQTHSSVHYLSSLYLC